MVSFWVANPVEVLKIDVFYLRWLDSNWMTVAVLHAGIVEA